MEISRAKSILSLLYVMCGDKLLTISENEVKEAIDMAQEALAEKRTRELESKYSFDDEAITSSTSIQADEGLFGYDDNQFFTRDDERDYIENPLCTTYGEGSKFRCYIDGNKLEVDWFVDDYEGTAKAIIDFRKIRKPSDLGKYLPIIEHQIDDETGLE